MSIKRKFTTYILGLFICAVAVILMLHVVEQNQLEYTTATAHSKLETVAYEAIELTIEQISELVGWYLTSTIDQKQEAILNTARSIRMNDIDDINAFKLKELATLNNIDIINVGDFEGKIVKSTYEPYVGVNIVEVFNEYSLMISQKVNVLPTDIFNYDGEVYTAIAVTANQGDGIYSFGARIDDFEENLIRMSESIPGVKSFGLYDMELNEIVTHSVLDESMNDLGIYDKSTISHVIKYSNPYIELEGESINVICPIVQNGNTRYIMMLDISKEPYYTSLNLYDDTFDSIENEMDSNLVYTMMLLITTVVIGLIAFLRAIRNDLKPLDDIVALTEEVAKGKLNVAFDVVTLDDFGKLAVAFNSMIIDLRILALELQLNADGLMEQSYRLSEFTSRYKESNILLRKMISEKSEIGDETMLLLARQEEELLSMVDSIYKMDRMICELYKHVDMYEL